MITEDGWPTKSKKYETYKTLTVLVMNILTETQINYYSRWTRKTINNYGKNTANNNESKQNDLHTMT